MPRLIAVSELVGPLGFEPRTKGFTWPRRFRRARTISSPVAPFAVWVRDALACHQGHWKPSGSLCTVRRCTAGLAQDRHQPPKALEGFPEFIPSTRTLSGPRHLSQKDESPALTTELQARRKSNKAHPRPLRIILIWPEISRAMAGLETMKPSFHVAPQVDKCRSRHDER